MRKLLIALAVVPAFGHAALVIDDGKNARASTGSAPVVTNAITPKSESKAVAASLPPASQIVEPVEKPAAKPLMVAPMWEATPADQTFQKLFARWGKQAGWTTFWEVGQDIPVVASSPFSGSFTDAVQDALDTTLGTDTPVHPCFFTNNVLRVLPTSTACDPK